MQFNYVRITKSCFEVLPLCLTFQVTLMYVPVIYMCGEYLQFVFKHLRVIQNNQTCTITSCTSLYVHVAMQTCTCAYTYMCVYAHVYVAMCYHKNISFYFLVDFNFSTDPIHQVIKLLIMMYMQQSHNTYIYMHLLLVNW